MNKNKLNLEEITILIIVMDIIIRILAVRLKAPQKAK
jgi:hypothetical protein